MQFRVKTIKLKRRSNFPSRFLLQFGFRNWLDETRDSVTLYVITFINTVSPNKQ